jgi:hypothetical protein
MIKKLPLLLPDKEAYMMVKFTYRFWVNYAIVIAVIFLLLIHKLKPGNTS